MKGRLKERGVIMEEIRRVRRECPQEDRNEEGETYAGAVRREGHTGRKASVERRKGKAEVLVTMEGKDSEEVRKEIMKEDPRQLGVKVERLIKTRKGLVVAVGNKEDAVRMVDSERLRGKGYVVKESVAKRPMLMVYDVGGGVEEKEVLKEMFERNFSESVTENEFLRAVKVRRRIKQRNGRGVSRIWTCR